MKQIKPYPGNRDSRFVTIRRGGTLKEEDHHLLALWAADCAEHVLRYLLNNIQMMTDHVLPSNKLEPGHMAKLQ